MTTPRCWGFRIAEDHREYLAGELKEGRLRQGWGYNPGQDLRKLTFDGGARRNRRMLEVKKGDLLLVPKLPTAEQVSIVEATEDWGAGYSFDIPQSIGDLGHVFPAKRITSFVRHNEHVTGAIRRTLRCRSRFWNIDHLYGDVHSLCEADDVRTASTPVARARDIAARVFDEVLPRDRFGNRVFAKLNKAFEGKEWETVLAAIVAMHYPSAHVEVVQGRSETHHGTDILVRLPDITGESRFAITIQVKDHVGMVDGAAIGQINKADHWEHQENLTVIQKIVVFTQAKRGDNKDVVRSAGDVQLVFADGLQKMVERWAIREAARACM